MFRTGNPALRNKEAWTGFENFGMGGGLAAAKPVGMTVAGTANATFILLGLCAASAVGTWTLLTPHLQAIQDGSAKPNMVLIWGLMLSGLVGTLIASLIMYFKPSTAPFVAPVHAITEGAFVGSFSGIVGMFVKGGGNLVIMAAVLTFGILAGLLLIYRTGLIKPSQKFRAGVAGATIGLCFLMLGYWLLSMFLGLPSLRGLGWLGIGISGVLIVLASLNLVCDFADIEDNAEAGAPKYMEWYGGFSLLTTLVWLYIEILRMLINLQSLLGGDE